MCLFEVCQKVEGALWIHNNSNHKLLNKIVPLKVKNYVWYSKVSFYYVSNL